MLNIFYNNFLFKYSRIILLLILVATAFMAYKALYLKIDASSDTLILEEDKDLKYFQLLSKRYKSSDFLVIAFTPKNYLLSNEVINTIEKISNDLSNLDQVKNVISIINVPLLESSKKTLADLLEGVPVLKNNLVPYEDIKKEFLNSELYKNNLVSSDFKTTAILVNLKDNLKLEKLREKKEKMKKIINSDIEDNADQLSYKNILSSLRLERDNHRNNQTKLISDVRNIIAKYKNEGSFFLGGIPMIANDVVEFVKGDLKIFGFSILLFLIAALTIIFRQLRWVLIPIITCFFSVTITTGLLSIFNWEVTVISSNYISLQLILTMAITIHLIVRYRELVLKNDYKGEQKLLVYSTLQNMIKPCFFTVITTIAGFSSLILSGLLPVINFGWMMSVGVSISLFLTFILFPILLNELEILHPNLKFEKKFNLPGRIANFAQNYNLLIFLLAISITFFGVFGIFKLKVENSFIDYFKSNTEINKGMRIIDQKLGGTTLLDVTIDFVDKDKKIKPVEFDNDDFEEDDLFSEIEDSTNDAKYWFTQDKMVAIEKLHDYLDSLPETGKVLSFATILKIGKKLNNQKPLDSVQLALLYEKLPSKYKDIILKPYISTENNQARITLRVKDSDPNLRRNELINKIKNQAPKIVNVNSDQIKLSNILILYNNMLQSLFTSQIKTLGLVVLVLFAMFMILFRSIKISIIALVPNLLAIGSVLGLMGILNIPLDMMTITIAAISMGIAVDNTIHYIFRHRIEFEKTSNYSQAMKNTHNSIGFALYYTTLTIIVGFSILVFSNFIPSIYFGLLTSLAMFIALLATLTLIPNLLSFMKPYK